MLFQRHGPPDADRLLVVLSDIEMGAGGPTDDFPHSEWLGDLLRSYQSAPYAGLQVDFVFNGDTFDLLKTSYNEEFPHHIDAKVALGKMERIIAAHQPFFTALREVLAAPGLARRAWFVVGNHDLEVLFPEVQARISRELGQSERVHFPGFSMRIGDVLIEHGQQTDDLFRTDATRPFVDYQGRAILNLSWAAVSLLEVAMPMHPVFYHLDRLKPREMVFKLMPEVRDLLVDAYWQYWVQRGWSWVTGDDPLKQVHWNVVKEVSTASAATMAMCTPAVILPSRCSTTSWCVSTSWAMSIGRAGRPGATARCSAQVRSVRSTCSRTTVWCCDASRRSTRRLGFAPIRC